MTDDEYNKLFAQQEHETLRGAAILGLVLCVAILLVAFVGGI
jgi:hypothetical protein